MPVFKVLHKFVCVVRFPKTSMRDLGGREIQGTIPEGSAENSPPVYWRNSV